MDALGLGSEVAVDDASRVGKGRLSAAEINLFLLDWMCSHKCTDKASSDLWQVVQMMLPEGACLPTFNSVKGTNNTSIF